MKRNNLALAMLAVVLVLGMSVGTAWAYFTDTTTADGSLTISVKPETDLEEDTPLGGTKTIRIRNNSEVVPVWTRVRVYSAIENEPQTAGTSWAADGDWYAYNAILEPGAQTEDLVINLQLKHPYDEETGQGTQNLEGYEENVVVVYESVPVSYNADGQPQPANWN